MVFLTLPELAPKIDANILSLAPSLVGIAHGVERGQDEAGSNKQSRPKGAIRPDLHEIDEWLDVRRDSS
jgi:hypothetical protein